MPWYEIKVRVYSCINCDQEIESEKPPEGWVKLTLAEDDHWRLVTVACSEACFMAAVKSATLGQLRDRAGRIRWTTQVIEA